MPSTPDTTKQGKLEIRPGTSIAISEIRDGIPDACPEASESLNQVGKALKAYLVAARDLLDKKYSDIREVAPPHMTGACRPFAFVFSDGIFVRYDREQNPELKVLVGRVTSAFREDGASFLPTLQNMAPALSESFLHCPADPSNYNPGDQTVNFTLSAISSVDGTAREIAKQRIYAIAPLRAPPSTNDAVARRPAPLISIRNEFDLFIEIEAQGTQADHHNRFLLRNQFRLPVGWEAIELFPPFQADDWTVDLAQSWAENDLLRAALQRNMIDRQFHAIDPSAEARKKIGKLISDCAQLLDGNEEPLHQFIKSNPGLLSPTHHRVWSKLSLGKRDTDFVFREPSGEYMLVELEKPSHMLFRNDGQQRQELTHAIDQVIDWRRYIEDNLRTVQDELGLHGISSNPSCLIVMGRSGSLDEPGRRKLVALQNAHPKLKIMTYDDMLENARATAENILGPLFYAGPATQVYLLPSEA